MLCLSFRSYSIFLDVNTQTLLIVVILVCLNKDLKAKKQTSVSLDGVAVFRLCFLSVTVERLLQSHPHKDLIRLNDTTRAARGPLKICQNPRESHQARSQDHITVTGFQKQAGRVRNEIHS